MTINTGDALPEVPLQHLTDGVQTVERVEVAEPGDGLLFRMKGGGAVRVSWHG